MQKGIRHFTDLEPAFGYRITYRLGNTNFCPACSGTQWHIGRHTAECAYCSTALPLADFAERRPSINPAGWRRVLRPFAMA